MVFSPQPLDVDVSGRPGAPSCCSHWLCPLLEHLNPADVRTWCFRFMFVILEGWWLRHRHSDKNFKRHPNNPLVFLVSVWNQEWIIVCAMESEFTRMFPTSMNQQRKSYGLFICLRCRPPYKRNSQSQAYPLFSVCLRLPQSFACAGSLWIMGALCLGAARPRREGEGRCGGGCEEARKE